MSLECSGGCLLSLCAEQKLNMQWVRSSAHFDYIRCTALDEKTGVFITGGGDGRVRAWTIKVCHADDAAHGPSRC